MPLAHADDVEELEGTCIIKVKSGERYCVGSCSE